MDDIEKKLQNYKVAVKEAEMKVAQLQGSWDDDLPASQGAIGSHF